MKDEQPVDIEFQEYLEHTFGPLRFTLSGLLQRAAEEAPDQPAILEPNRESLTYAGLLKLAEKTVRVLNGMGFGPGNRIALVLPTNGAAAAAYLSVMAGMTIIPLSAALYEGDYERSFGDTGAQAVVVQHNTVESAVVAARRLMLPVIELLVVADGPVGMFEIRGADEVPDVEPAFAQPEDIAVRMPTSGTTSLPKMVLRTQKQLMIYFYVNTVSLLPFGGVMINQMPLHHLSGFSLVMFAVIAKSGFTCLPRFEANEIYRYLAQYQPSWFGAVPAMLQALVSEAPRHRAELQQFHIKKIATGSAALPDALLHEVHKIFGASIQLIYGLTETGPIANIVQDPDSSTYRVGAVGKPGPFVQVQIADEDGAALPAGEEGEIQILSPVVFSGYENNPEANALAFRDSWFRTGDAGYLDGDGYLYLTGRIKDVINRGGSKISPLDVDAVLSQHPAVLEAAAFGFPHAVLGEDIAAAIVLQDPQVTEDELRLFAFRSLPMHSVPSRFVFVEEIPKTALGKIKRNLLAERFKAELRR